MSSTPPEAPLDATSRGNEARTLQSRLEDATSYSFLAASGPGGQNVNKVATACQLRCDVYKLGLAPDVFARLKTLAGSRMTSGGEIVITARRYRTQEANRDDARARLADLVARAHVRQPKRIKTKASRAAKAKRVDSKTRRGTVKQGRGKVQLD
jgi:ribosome-associated protein